MANGRPGWGSEIPDDELRLRKAAAKEVRGAGPIESDCYAKLAKRRGIDFATAALFERYCRIAGTQQMLAEVEEEPSPEGPRDALLALVPGVLYHEYPHTGADGWIVRTVAESLGWWTELVPLPSQGTLQQNGELLLRWLEERADRRVLIWSLSKGSSDVQAAFEMASGESVCDSVIGWISCSGILCGSPMASWILERRLSRLLFRGLFAVAGHDFHMVHELAYKAEQSEAKNLPVPEQIEPVHVAGFPLVRHLSSSRAARWHRRLSVWGPNDSVSVLADLASWPGHVWPVWGADHYLQERRLTEPLIEALLRTVSVPKKISATAT